MEFAEHKTFPADIKAKALEVAEALEGLVWANDTGGVVWEPFEPQLTIAQALMDERRHAEPELVFKNVETGEIVGPFVPFLPVTRAVYAIQTPNGWREVPAMRRDGRFALLGTIERAVQAALAP